MTRVSDRCHRLKHPLSSTTDHTPSFHRLPYEHVDDLFCIQECSRNCPGIDEKTSALGPLPPTGRCHSSRSCSSHLWCCSGPHRCQRQSPVDDHQAWEEAYRLGEFRSWRLASESGNHSNAVPASGHVELLGFCHRSVPSGLGDPLVSFAAARILRVRTFVQRVSSRAPMLRR